MRQAICAISILLTGISLAEPAPLRPPDRAEVLTAARDVIKQAHFAALITLSEDGQPQARVLDPSDPDPDFTVWLGTKSVTRKVAQLRKNSHANLFYFDKPSMSYVTLVGSAQLVSDPSEKERHWQARWAPFYPEGSKSTELILIRFTPTRLEVVSAAHKLQNDPQSWRPVILELK